MSDSSLLFEVDTPLGFRVRVEQARWNLIVEIKHPILRGQENLIQAALTDPDEVRQSRSDETIYLFYKTIQERRWACAVVKVFEQAGFLITAYPTDAIKEGTQLWKK